MKISFRSLEEMMNPKEMKNILGGSSDYCSKSGNSCSGVCMTPGLKCTEWKSPYATNSSCICE